MKKKLNSDFFPVIPRPNRVRLLGNETVFELTDYANLVDESGTEGIFSDFCDFTERAFGYAPHGGGYETLRLTLDDSVDHPEGYALSVEKNLVTVKASRAAGLFYGLQTLKQLLLSGEGKLAPMTVEDKPRFSERGFMLDVGRYFYTVDCVKRFIDAMAFHKLNRLHLHLTEDQGWRVEIDSYPLLTVIGSDRSHTNFNNKRHRGFYTKSDIGEIVAYAHSRYIKVVPEIDMPGHSVAAIAAYPELSCFNRQLQVATHWGIKHDILCAGRETTYDFVFSVLEEIIELFPDGEVHLGADEAVKTRWRLCPDCQRKMKQLGLEDENRLQAHFISRVLEHFEGRGVSFTMWSDAEGKDCYRSDIRWQYWSGSLSRRDLAEQMKNGRAVLNSCSEAYYLDLPYGQIDLKKCYEYEPEYAEFKGIAKPEGVEACLWTEYVPSMYKAGYCTFPRLGAVCESAWTEPENKAYEDFSKRLPLYYSMLDLYALDYAKPNQAMPGFLRKYGYLLYWKRRPLHWEGLHNLLDNRKVEKQAKQKA